MKGGSLESMENSDGRTHALERHIDVISSTNGLAPVPLMAQIFANAGREHMERYGTNQFLFIHRFGNKIRLPFRPILNSHFFKILLSKLFSFFLESRNLKK